MKNIVFSALAILLSAATFASADVFVKDAILFDDGTRLTTATEQGPAGLQGVPGLKGPQGSAGNNGILTLETICAAITAGGAPLPTFCSFTVSTVVTPAGGGSIDPANRTVASGNTTTFTVTANSGYQISTVTGCGGNLSGNSYTTGAITASCTVTAGFSATTLTDPTTGMLFNKVTGGTFTMGDTFGDSGVGSYELPTHQVTLSDFYIGRYEVTQGEWQTVMGSNPSTFTACGASCPVEQVSWNDAQTFISALNTRSGKSYRLPTEAEWEYAARSGGQSQKYSGGSDVNAVAWYAANSGNTTHAAGQKLANGLALYDMSGNVWEWVSDWFGGYGSAPQTNPTGPATGFYRVVRGGGWSNGADFARASYRLYVTPDYRNNNLGFRLVAPLH